MITSNNYYIYIKCYLSFARIVADEMQGTDGLAWLLSGYSGVLLKKIL